MNYRDRQNNPIDFDDYSIEKSLIADEVTIVDGVSIVKSYKGLSGLVFVVYTSDYVADYNTEEWADNDVARLILDIGIGVELGLVTKAHECGIDIAVYYRASSDSYVVLNNGVETEFATRIEADEYFQGIC